MQQAHRKQQIERFIAVAIVGACAMAAMSFALLLGFEMTTLSRTVLYVIQMVALFIFIAEKFFRMLTARSASQYAKIHWLGLSLIALLFIVLAASGGFGQSAHTVRHYAIGIYLLLQIVSKISNFAADIAARGRNPANVIVGSFIILIVLGTVFLMLPKSTVAGKISFADALFTATSAACLTGLTVQDTGAYFTHRGHVVVLALIQIGALGIIIFGAVFALMMRQAWNAGERAAIQDMLSMEARSRLGKMMLFVFASTAVIELLGALFLLNMWPSETLGENRGTVFLSIFHSVSAFCNSGFTLFSNSLNAYRHSFGVYLIICPLVILGGLGFAVLYNILCIILDKIRRAFCRKFNQISPLLETPPKKAELQTRVVLITSAILIIGGAIGLLLFENIMPMAVIKPDGLEAAAAPQESFGILDALFQSVTARTAGFSTVDIGSLSPPSLFILTLLMLIGGSPGSAAGGIKTVTIAIIAMTAWTTLRKRSSVEISSRSIPLLAVGRAITIALLFLSTLFAATLLLCITERNSGFTTQQLLFESASALGSVGLTTGITHSLTTAGKWLIIVAMLIGRLGPLTLLTSLTLNIKPVRYSYPEEPIMVG
jgi:trk system potassium uptake protein TrkH